MVYIGDLGIDLVDNCSIEKFLNYVDDSKYFRPVTGTEDVEVTQLKLNSFYALAQENNMKWNDLKFRV